MAEYRTPLCGRQCRDVHNKRLIHQLSGTRSQLSGTTYRDEDSYSPSKVSSPRTADQILARTTWHYIKAHLPENPIGRGGFGEVYKCRVQGKDIAVKKLNIQRISGLILKKTMRSEKHIVGLSHPNLVKVYAVDQTAVQYPIVVMEFAGADLQRTLNEQMLTFSELVQYSIDIARGLECLHSFNLLHLDLKPQNIFINTQRNATIGDFGCVQKLNEADETEGIFFLDSGTETRARGTVAYMAPERFTWKYPTEAADIYSLGIVMWQMRSRRFPYTPKDPIQDPMSSAQIIYRVSVMNLRPDCTDLEDCPLFLSLCEKCWRSDIQQRASSAKYVIDHLSQCQYG